MAKKAIRKQKKAAPVAPKKRGRKPKVEQKTPIQLAKKIEFKDPRELKGYEGNAKAHSLDQIQLLANSIQKFGFNAPILIDGLNTVIAGHGRLAAALQLGLKSIPVVVLDHMTDDERRAYIIADNKLGEVGVAWSDEMLAKELADLDDHDFDLSSLGFDESELEELLPDLEDEADEILARDDKKQSEQSPDESGEDDPEKESADEHDEDQAFMDRDSKREKETTEIDIEKIPSTDHVDKPATPAELDAFTVKLRLPELEKESRERMERYNPGTDEWDYFNRVSCAIVMLNSKVAREHKQNE